VAVGRFRPAAARSAPSAVIGTVLNVSADLRHVVEQAGEGPHRLVVELGQRVDAAREPAQVVAARVWKATAVDGPATVLTADSAAELREKVRDDYTQRRRLATGAHR
jgi:hypothetical protein